jgi:DNA-binding transcriptional regulator LsrR (DeoR family)
MPQREGSRMARTTEAEDTRLDDAARAGWLYYVAGNTQDEIARKLGISRQSAQRLVSLAIAERLIKVRLDHPIARCLELAAALRIRYDLSFCEIAPTDPMNSSTTVGIAQVAAAEMERWLRRPEPAVIGIGTGRTMRAVADQLPPMECPHHKLVALVGNTKADGSASFYDVIIRVSDTVRAPHFPMPLPVIARSREERELLTSLESVRNVLGLIELADVTFVGIGVLGENSALLKDGFITQAESEALRAAGAVGEITGWAFDGRGRLVSGHTNERVSSAPLRQPTNRLMIGVAMGAVRRPALRGALAGRLISGLVTDEATAEHLLQR